MAKFRGDRPTKLGDLAAKQKQRKSAVKHKTVGNYRSGRPEKLQQKFIRLTIRTVSHYQSWIERDHPGGSPRRLADDRRRSRVSVVTTRCSIAAR